MPGLLNLLNNPLALLVVLAGTWYTTKDFIAFTAVIMAFVSIQVALEKIVNNKVPKFLFASWLLLMPLGTMTLVFRDPAFLQWKFSVVHWLFGVILIGSRLIGKMDILKLIFSAAGTQLNNVEDIIWKRINLYMAFGFILLGFINLYIMRFYDLEFWVNFKLYGVLAYNLVLTSTAIFYLYSKAEKEQDIDRKEEEINV
tara:strand:+ start:686 stop:1282 length:597 start_codon:yes stop_codon:yes gene_type:complete